VPSNCYQLSVKQQLAGGGVGSTRLQHIYSISLIAGIEGMVAFMLFYEGGGGHRFLQFS
jgi:hypothetical protein